MPTRVRAALVAVAVGLLGASALVAWTAPVSSTLAEHAASEIERRAPSLEAWQPKVPAPLRAAVGRSPLLLAVLVGVAALVASWVPVRSHPTPILATRRASARPSVPRGPPLPTSTPR
ncbi:MAG TPA: hypothetical protein P5254_17535 [Aquihabitans sp.]|nr:hypothetical protein [Aquihabitans sp.]